MADWSYRRRRTPWQQRAVINARAPPLPAMTTPPSTLNDPRFAGLSVVTSFDGNATNLTNTTDTLVNQSFLDSCASSPLSEGANPRVYMYDPDNIFQRPPPPASLRQAPATVGPDWRAEMGVTLNGPLPRVRKSPVESSFLLTPDTESCSTPEGWTEELPSEPLQLTFGIEIEHIFCMDKKVGGKHAWMLLDEDSPTDNNFDDESDESSVKANPFSPAASAMTSQTAATSVSSCTSSPPITNTQAATLVPQIRTVFAIRRDTRPTFLAELRKYGEEQEFWQTVCFMDVQQRILQRAGLECLVDEQDSMFWCVKGDASLETGSPDLLELFPEKNLSLEQALYWGKGCHEIVSPVLVAPKAPELGSFQLFCQSPAMESIQRYTTALRAGPTDPWGAYVNETCGFHVHIACKPRPGSLDVALPLPVLQHLAYLLYQYEELIIHLHSVSRRAVYDDGDINDYIGSNLQGFKRTAHVCRKHMALDLNNARRKIFAKEMTVERLAKLMSTKIYHHYKDGPNHAEDLVEMISYEKTRYKFVNFQRLYDEDVDDDAKTIEFRQHAGTVDFEEIARWVHFIICLIHAAERKALWAERNSLGPSDDTTLLRRPSFQDRQGFKYNDREDGLLWEYHELFNVLGFDRESRDYWQHKAFKSTPWDPREEICVDENGKERWFYTEMECPACPDGKYYDDGY